MPFNITDQKELRLLSEYLIDDEDSDEKIDEYSEQSLIIVKSIFVRLLGNYEGKYKKEYDAYSKSIIEVELSLI